MFPQHDKPFLSSEYLFIYRTCEEFFSGRSDNDSAQVRIPHQYARPAFRCGPVTKNRPHTLHLIRSEPSSKLTEDCFPTCDCECKRLWLRQYTPHLWKILRPQQDIGSIRCLDSFLPFCTLHWTREWNSRLYGETS